MDIIELKRVSELTMQYNIVIEDMRKLDEMASIMADTEYGVSFNMKIKDEPKEKNTHAKGNINGIQILCGCPECMSKFTQKAEQKESIELSQNIKDTTGLQILGVLLEIQQQKEKKILQELKELGIDI